MSKAIDDLVEKLTDEFTGHPSSGCWASRLEGDAAEFIEKVREVDRSGRKIRRGVIVKTLKDHFDVKVGEDAVRNHLLGHCKCQ